MHGPHNPIDRFSTSLSREIRSDVLLTTLRLTLPTLPEALIGYRIVFMTDFHFGVATSFEHLHRIFEIAGGLNANLVLSGGDNIQLTRHLRVRDVVYWQKNGRDKLRRYEMDVSDAARAMMPLWSQFAPSDGMFGVFGNHDYFEGARIIKKALSNRMTILRNESRRVERLGTALEIIGVDDLLRGKPDIDRAFSQTAPESIKIALIHNPDTVLHDQNQALQGAHLVLCGHTHGGQVRLPMIGAIVTRTKQKKHVQGLDYHGETPVYVSQGVGYGGVSLRLNCPPEILLLEFGR